MEENKRPWGEYEVLLDKSYTKVKEITVNPKGKLSLQYHNYREERWIITQGRGEVTIGKNVSRVYPGDVITIPFRAIHRIENIGEDILTFIEVQTGISFEENDIIRVEDEYGRVDAQ
jgi:mannose-6-phosphate isomerase